MDYRYETKDEARDFHKQRKAFIILNNVLEFYQKIVRCLILSIVKLKA